MPPIFLNERSLYMQRKANFLNFVGGSCKSKRLSYRVVAGTWALATFIFVQAYTSILFTYIVTPISSPLINSVYDVMERSEIHLYIKKGSDLDFAFSVKVQLTNFLLHFLNILCSSVINCSFTYISRILV